jgi:uncharacterized protein (UPF0276 family)
MDFAVNYSTQAADLLRQGKIQVDRFKCPDWPEIIIPARALRPVHVHFSLRVGPGIRDAVDTQTHQAADWSQIESLLLQTNTRWVNLHLSPTAYDYPDLSPDTIEPAHVDYLTERMIQDVQAVVQRFGPERVVVENLPNDMRRLRPAFLPQVIRRVVEETGCGFLFDLSHARLAAGTLGMDPYEYVSGLPTGCLVEVHVTGIQRFEGKWLERARQAGVDPAFIEHRAGHLFDHLPLTGEDWAFFTWAIEQIRAGRWRRPELITFEYGGVGSIFEAVGSVTVLAEQVPRLYALVKNGTH